MNEAFSYLQTNVKGVSQLEQRLRDLGLQTGRKCLEIFAFRQRLFKRQTAAATSQNARIELLGWVSGEFWRWLFGKPADSLEKNTETEGEFMIWEDSPVYCTFNSVPKELGDFTTASFTAGIVQSVLTSYSFDCTVTAHCCPIQPDRMNRTLYLIRFKEASN